MKAILKICTFSIFAIQLSACRNKEIKEIKPADIDADCGCDVTPPPPPPPLPFQEFKTESIHMDYGGKRIIFETTLLSNRLFDLGGKELQTFFIVASNGHETDSFYFALPPEFNTHWEDLTIQKTKADFNIGFYEENEKFKSLYTVYLGDELNRGRIFLKQFNKP